MSSSSDFPEMNCADFEKSFDQYVDDMLVPAVATAARRHAANCAACNREVTRWQQSRILLSTAVSDFATAVDVSSVRDDVFAALGLDVAERRHAGVAGERESRHENGRDAGHENGRDATYARGEDSHRQAQERGRSARRAGRRSGEADRRSSMSAVWRFASAATVSALTAAAAVLLLTPEPATGPSIVAGLQPVAQSPASYAPANFRTNPRRQEDILPVAYTPPPLARPQTSHVDGLEAAPGQLVSTWVQPRTNARVIWVQDRGVGAPIRTAGLDR